MCSVAEELETSGRDDVSEWWLVSTSPDLFFGDAGPLKNMQYMAHAPIVKCIQVTHQLLSPEGPCFCSIENDRRTKTHRSWNFMKHESKLVTYVPGSVKVWLIILLYGRETKLRFTMSKSVQMMNVCQSINC